MYELIKVSQNCYYVNSPVKIGLYTQGEDAFLIDSGNDKEAGRKLRKILDENNLKLKAIINTHSNADHIGGNNYLQKQTNCKIYAKGIEKAFTQYPVLEPAFLYGGYPFSDLRHKFLMAQESNVLDIQQLEKPEDMEIIDLKGHFFDMIGVKIGDVAYLADCVNSEAALKKYKFTFIYDVKSYLDTLDYIEKIDAKIFIPSHTEPTDDIKKLSDINRKNVFEICDFIIDMLNNELIFEDILKKAFDTYSLTMTYEQYVLVGSTIRSFLSYLKDTNKITTEIKNNYIYFKRV